MKLRFLVYAGVILMVGVMGPASYMVGGAPSLTFYMLGVVAGAVLSQVASE